MSNASDTPLAEKIAAIEKALKRARVLMSGKNPSPSFNAMLTLRNEVEEAMPALTSLAKDVAAMEEALARRVRVLFTGRVNLNLAMGSVRQHGSADAALAAAAKGQGKPE
jgi:uncharacterized protein YfcZ (UPF0381/DUF406 family)